MSGKSKELPIVKKKRFSKIACIPCRGNHLKCDGARPCHPCQKKGVTCEYAQPKKRGPKTNELQLLKMQLLQDCDELCSKIAELTEEEQKKKDQIESKDYFSNTNSERTITLFSRTNGAKSLELDSRFQFYCSSYFEYFHPQLKIIDQPTSFNNIDRKKVLKLIKDDNNMEGKFFYLLINAMFSLAARTTGEHKDAREFAEEARRYLGMVYDESDYRMAQAYSLLAHYMYSEGFIKKAFSYSSFARGICKNLNMFDNWAYKLASISVGLNTNDTEERDLLFDHVINSGDVSTRDLSFYLFAKVWGDILLNKNFFNYIPLMELIKDIEQRIHNSQEPEHEGVIVVDKIFVYFGKMLLFQSTCLFDSALYWGDEIIRLSLITNNRLLLLPVALVISIVTRLHIILNRKDKILNDLLCLEKLSAIYPFAKNVMQILSSELGISMGKPLNDDLLSFVVPRDYKPSSPSIIEERKITSITQFHQYYGVPPGKISAWDIVSFLQKQQEQFKIISRFAPHFSSLTKEVSMNIDDSSLDHLFIVPNEVKRENVLGSGQNQLPCNNIISFPIINNNNNNNNNNNYNIANAYKDHIMFIQMISLIITVKPQA